VDRVGRYEILSEIGRGGMARVHLARQLDLDRFVALKELGSLQREDAQLVGRFLRESRVAGGLNHPSIVTVFDYFEADGVQYIAMEYVPRGSLRSWVGRLSPAQLGGVLENLLAGLAHAHAAGIVHRDLKPENLMITADGRIKIADFGIAKALAEEGTSAFRTATGVAIGTPAYMAPEQAMAREVGPWTDLYASGVISYELLAGSVPFSAGEPLAVLLAHCQQEPPPLAERAPGVAPPLAGWVHGLLAKDPAARPPSARAAWEELEEHLLESLGPRWRREARIEGGSASEHTPRPMTPAPFPEDRAVPADEDEGWVTFGSPPATTPPPAASPPTPPPAAGPEEPRVQEPAPAEPRVDEPRVEEPPPEEPRAEEPRVQEPRPAEPPPAEPPPPEPPPPERAAEEPLPEEPVAEEPPPQQPAAPRGRRAPLIAGAAVAVVAVSVAVALLAGGGDDGADDSASAPPRIQVAGATTAAAPLGDRWLRAIHLQSYDADGPRKPEFAAALRQAKADGASHVVFTPVFATDSDSAAELRDQDDRPADESFAAGLDAIRKAGMKPIVQPIVEPPDFYSGDYDPDDFDAFFDAYSERIGEYADMGRRYGTDMFVIGTVLSQIDGDEHADRWTQLARDAKARCGCRTSYAAEDPEHAGSVGFWAGVDVIGVDTLNALTEEPTIDVAELTSAWAPVKGALAALNARYHKPVWIPELGYTSRAGQSAMSPFDEEGEGEPSEEAQAALYEAAFRAFRGTPWFAGIGWFELNGDGAEPKPLDYAFVGKRGEQVLRAWHTAS
jgi:serine/threonine protein kinase